MNTAAYFPFDGIEPEPAWEPTVMQALGLGEDETPLHWLAPEEVLQLLQDVVLDLATSCVPERLPFVLPPTTLGAVRAVVDAVRERLQRLEDERRALARAHRFGDLATVTELLDTLAAETL